jgi:RimJ/RimL family protein N-acetyltransferase
MATLSRPLERVESDRFAERIEDEFERSGYGLFAVEVVGVDPFVGFVGLHEATFEAAFTPAVEIGWRIASAHWGRGYAPEAATEVLRFAFDDIGLAEVVSFTAAINDKSRRVMNKIGLRYDASGDFEHPNVTIGDPLRPHVLYRLSAGEWRARQLPSSA